MKGDVMAIGAKKISDSAPVDDGEGDGKDEGDEGDSYGKVANDALNSLADIMGIRESDREKFQEAFKTATAACMSDKE